MATVERDVEGEFISALHTSLESSVHKTFKEEQRECIRRIVSEKEGINVLNSGLDVHVKK